MSAYVFQAAESRRGKQRRRKGEREIEEQEAKSFVESLGAGIEPPPFDMSLGPREERLDVPEGCVGMLIGKKGENMKRIERQCRVTVSIKDGEDAGSRAVIVKGSTVDVAAALRELDFASKTVDVPEVMAGWICGRGARHLRLIKELTGAAVVSLRREGEENGGPRAGASSSSSRGVPGGSAAAKTGGAGAAAAASTEADSGAKPAADSGRCWLELKGRRECVADAHMCLEAHLSYYPVFQEMEELDADLDRQIAAAQARLGRRPGRSAAAAERGAERTSRGAERTDRGATLNGSRGSARAERGMNSTVSASAPIGSSPLRSRGRGGGRGGSAQSGAAAAQGDPLRGR
uniref:K Homology domain-containing protein n=1 Tax=Alexandrium monilatum TaxID=311494 RepID=A0A7S4PW77_9DINO|mmetsp:Transcript_38949/g.121288  ORF Transcript_38949/g.121288 Transcript_38949/m.121288 type:complete len:348 (+) Transcript_38949:63-1106(+)